MGFNYTTYFGFARVSEMGPEVKNWSVLDYNPEITSLLIKQLTAHTHGGATPIHYPGYNYATPATPVLPVIAEGVSDVGVLSPGSVIGVRFGYVNNIGLETESSPEYRLTMTSLPERPDPPELAPPVLVPNSTSLLGGTYVYALTKGKGTGETQLSGVQTVDVPFDPTGQTYTVTVNFDSVSTYDDGTDNIKLYRAQGLSAEFGLVKTFTDPVVASYIDTGLDEDATVFPPVINTFDKNKYVSINWSTFVHPPSSVAMRVYITQTPGVYGVNHLLEEINLTTPFKKQTNYLGSETLDTVWPKEFSQLPDNPGKIQLQAEATGAPVYTQYANANGYETMNFVLPWNLAHSTPVRGAMYYDFSTDSVKLRLASGFTTLATPGGVYIHPAVESGGHAATGITFGSQNVNSVAAIIANSTAGQVRKQVTPIQYATPSQANYKVTSTSAVIIPEAQIQVTPQFAGQWFEFNFSGSVLVDPRGSPNGQLAILGEFNGVQDIGFWRSYSAPATPMLHGAELTYATPISRSVTLRMFWAVSTGTEAMSLGNRRFLLGKGLF